MKTLQLQQQQKYQTRQKSRWDGFNFNNLYIYLFYTCPLGFSLLWLVIVVNPLSLSSSSSSTTRGSFLIIIKSKVNLLWKGMFVFVSLQICRLNKNVVALCNCLLFFTQDANLLFSFLPRHDTTRHDKPKIIFGVVHDFVWSRDIHMILTNYNNILFFLYMLQVNKYSSCIIPTQHKTRRQSLTYSLLNNVHNQWEIVVRMPFPSQHLVEHLNDASETRYLSNLSLFYACSKWTPIRLKRIVLSTTIVISNQIQSLTMVF